MANEKLTGLTLLMATENSDLVYIVTINGSDIQVSRAIRVQDFLKNQVQNVNRIISGAVVWTGTGFVWESVRLTVEIGGTIYYSHEEQITNSAPDGANPRLDVIFMSASGLGIKLGTPAGSPTEPNLDNPEEELKTNLVLVTNGQTEPTGVVYAPVYLENAQVVGGEYDTSSSSGVIFDLENTTNPITDSKDIYTIATVTANSWIKFIDAATPIAIADFNNIRMNIKQKGNDWKKDYIELRFYDSGLYVGSGRIDRNSLDMRNTTTPQEVVILKADITWFEYISSDFDTVEFWFRSNNANTKISVQIDDIYIQSGDEVTDPDIAVEHVGEVTGTEELTLDVTSITNRDIVTAVGTDYVYILDVTDGTLKRALISDFASAGGDMTIAVYDPTAVSGDAFDMDNMEEPSTGKTTPIDADTLSLFDSISSSFKKLTWANVKATLLAYFDTKYKTHTGEITGEQALTLHPTAISNKGLVTVASGDHIPIIDLTDGTIKKIVASDLLGGVGDMLIATYDPTAVSDDAFDMDNMAQESVAQTTPVDADTLSLFEAAGAVFKKVTWANIKATLKVVNDLLYAVIKFEEHLIIEFNPKGTELAIDTGLREFQMPDYATTLYQVPSVQLTDPPTGSIATFDLNEAGSTVLGDKITIDAGEKSSEDAAAPPTLTDTAIAANAIMTIDIDGIGSTNPGEGGKLILYYKRA